MNVLGMIHLMVADAAGHSTPTANLPVVALLAGLSIVAVMACIVTLRPVFDPNRAIIFRLATLHRVAGPGYVFVLPLLDHVETELDMGERESRLALIDGRTADGGKLSPRLEVTWRIHPHVRGKPSAQIRAMLLLPEERRAKLVDEVVLGATRRVISDYTLPDLTHAGARESAMTTVAFLANDELALRGLLVERVFWRV